MAGLIKPQKDFRGDSDLPMETGWHIVQCTEVADLPASQKWSNAKPRVIFVFRKYNPRFNSLYPDKASFICSATVFMGNEKFPESQLVKFAKMVGYKNIQNGVNPLAWKDRFFAVYVRNNGKDAYVELIAPVEEPQGDTPEDREAWQELEITSNRHYGKESRDEPTAVDDSPF